MEGNLHLYFLNLPLKFSIFLIMNIGNKLQLALAQVSSIEDYNYTCISK